MGLIKKLFGSYSERELKRVYPIQQKVLALEETYKAKSDAELKAVTPALKELSLIHLCLRRPMDEFGHAHPFKVKR